MPFSRSSAPAPQTCHACATSEAGTGARWEPELAGELRAVVQRAVEHNRQAMNGDDLGSLIAVNANRGSSGDE